MTPKRWLVTFETYNKNGDAVPAVQVIEAASEADARKIFVREHNNDGMTYKILLVTEIPN